MPLLYYRSLEKAEVALWKTQEPTDFYETELLKQEFPTAPGAKIRHPEKRRQWFASRYLLCEVYPAAIQLYHNQKPFLLNGPEVSFSHSSDVVGIMISENHAGIDLQYPDRKLEKVSSKFLSAGDESTFGDMPRLDRLTCIWAVKEATFKIFGAGLPFKSIKLKAYDSVKDEVDVEVEKEDTTYRFKLALVFLNDLVLAYLLK